MVPTDLRYTKDHEWVRVDGDEATVGITEYAADQLGDIVFVELPEAGRTLEQFATFGVVESVKAVSDLFAPVSGEVLATNEALTGSPELVNADPYGGGWMIRIKLAKPEEVDELLDADGVRRPDRGRLSAMPYGPHTAEDRERMLATLGIGGVDELFADIPAPLRASRLDLPEPEPELQLAARLEGLAATQPDGPRLVPRGGRLSPLDPGGGRPASPARRVVHGLHAVPARDQPGDAPEHLRVRVADRRADGLDVVSASHYDGAAATAEAALMTCRATRRERVLVSRAVHPHYRQTVQAYFGGGLEVEEIPVVADGPDSGTTDLAALERLLADTDRPVAGVVAGQPNFFGLLEPMAEIGRLAHAAGALFVAVVEPVSLAVLAPPGAYGADIAAGEGQPLGIAPQYGGPYLGLLASTDALVRQIPGRLVGHDDRPRWQAGLRHDDARPRAGHPPRQGREQHLHEPGAPRARGEHLRLDPRSARAARRRRASGPPAPPSSRRPSPASASDGCTRARTSTSSPCASRARGTSIAGSSSAASSPDSPWPTSSPTIPALADALLVCATEVTTSEEIARFASGLDDVLSGRPPVGVEAGAGAERARHGRHGAERPPEPAPTRVRA